MIRKPLRQRRLVVMLAALSLAGIAYAQANFSSLEERMSYKEFKEYGLDKLTPEQLRGLNDWLRAHGATGGSAGIGSARAVAAPSAGATAAAATDADGRIVSPLVGDFNGWHQGTVLTLANGTRWEVRNDDTVYGHGDHNPEVTVEQRSIVGGWVLSVEGYNDIAHVLPVKK